MQFRRRRALEENRSDKLETVRRVVYVDVK